VTLPRAAWKGAVARSVVRRALEAPIEGRFVAGCADVGVVTLKLTLRYDSGWPDRLVLIPRGRPLFVELKRPGDLPRALQEQRHTMLRALGYDVEVHDTSEGAVGAVVAACQRARERAHEHGP
jgi:hypothetical protein